MILTWPWLTPWYTDWRSLRYSYQCSVCCADHFTVMGGHSLFPSVRQCWLNVYRLGVHSMFTHWSLTGHSMFLNVHWMFTGVGLDGVIRIHIKGRAARHGSVAHGGRAWWSDTKQSRRNTGGEKGLHEEDKGCECAVRGGVLTPTNRMGSRDTGKNK